MDKGKQVFVKYSGEDTWVLLRCRWTDKAEKDLHKHHGLDLVDEVTRYIVAVAGANHRLDNELGSDVHLEIKVDEKYYGTYISHSDGSYTLVAYGDQKIDWKFRPDATGVATDDYWYDLTDGGYIELDKLLADAVQAQAVIDAVKTLHSFREALIAADLLELM